MFGSSRLRGSAQVPVVQSPPARRHAPAAVRLLAVAAATVGFGAAGAAPAAASTACTPAAADIISPSCFEGGDGNLVTDNANGTGRFDWSTMTAFAGAPITFADDTGDSQFAPGNSAKEESPGDWVINTGNVSNKTDLAAAAIKSDPVSNDIFFYGAFARPLPNGDANLSFELNKVGGRWDLRAPGGPVPSATGVPYRSNGDLLLTFDGNAGAVKVGLCKWFGGPELNYNGYLGKAAGGSPTYGWQLLDGSALDKSCTTLSTVSLATRTAFGAMNGAILNGVSAILPSFPDTLPVDGFGEVSVNLSQALETTVDPNPCFSFGSVWLHSRSSSEPGANMEDFVAPTALVGAKSCSIAVDKSVAVNDAAGDYKQEGNGTTFTADPSWANPGDTLHYSIAVTNDGQVPVALQTPTDPRCAATPTIVPADKSQTAAPAGVDQTPSTFDPGDTWVYRCSTVVGSTATAPVLNTVTVNGSVGAAPGLVKNLSGTDSTKTAIKSRLFVRKVNVGGAPADLFDFTTSADMSPASFTLAGGAQREFANLLPNSGADATTNVYTVTEGAETGYDLTGLVCRTGPAAGDPVAAGTTINGATATVLLTPGQSQYCTYTNTKQATVTVVKDADPADGTDFAFTGSFGAFDLDDGGPADATPTSRQFSVSGADFGTKSLSETGVAGWQLTGIVCNAAAEASNESLAGNGGSTDIKVDPGDVITCTFTNAKDASVTVVKAADPADGTDFAFTGSFGAFDLDDGGPADATPTSRQFSVSGADFGTKSLSETGVAGWQLTGIVCNAAAEASNESLAGNGGSTDIKVDPGDVITCTFTNRKDASVTVVKAADPADGTDFAFTGSFGAFDLDDGGPADATPTSRQFSVGGADFGTKSLSETGVAGWQLTGVVCNAAAEASNESLAGNGGSTDIKVDPGDVITCTFTNRKDASVTVVKAADPADGTDFAFTGSFGAFDLDDGGPADATPTSRQFTVSGADFGTKSITETGLAGWQLTDIACNTAAEASNESLAGNGGTTDIKVDPGDAITCTFVNEKDATINIVKDADPADGTTFDFTSTIAGNATFGLTDGQTEIITTGDFGTRTVTEVAEAGWQLTDIACNAAADASNETLAGDGGATDIKVDPGDVITCTFTNKKDATVTVVKDADPADGTDFAFTGSFGAFDLDDGGAADATNTSEQFTVGGADFGTKSITETGETGWQLTGIVCNAAAEASNESLAGNGGSTDIKVDPGDVITCTFTNVKDARVTIVKDAIADDAQDFTFTPTGVLPQNPSSFLLDDDADNTLANTRVFAGLDTFGTATVTETQVTGWDLELIACLDAQGAPAATVKYGTITGGTFATGAADASRDGFDIGDTALEIDVQPGVDATCTFTNKKVALNVAKVAVQVQPVNAGDVVGFDITTSNPGPGVARDVVTTDPLPAGVTWAIAPVGQGTDATSAAACQITGVPDAQTLQCAYGDLAAGASFTVRVEATTGTTAAACQDFDNTAQVTASNAAPDQSSASVSCQRPAMSIAKSTATPAIAGGDVAMFGVTITNAGPGAAKDVVVEDVLPAGLTWTADGALPAGCAIGDVVVAGQTRQRVTCSFASFGVNSVTFNVKATTTVTACETYVNDVTLAGGNFAGSGASATIVCTKPDPVIAIDKVGPASATAGDTLTFAMNVSNPGQTPFSEAQLSIDDPRCDGGTLVLTGKNGDASSTSLDPGDTWSYACTIATVAGMTSVTNIATINGVDVNGRPATATDDAVTALVQPPPPPPPAPSAARAPVIAAAQSAPPTPVVAAAVSPGRARLRGPSGCLKAGTSRVYITGSQIRSVRFVVDGKTRRTVRRADKHGRWMMTVKRHRLKRGAHRVQAVVTFRAPSQTKSKKFQVRFSRCASRVLSGRVRGLTG